MKTKAFLAATSLVLAIASAASAANVSLLEFPQPTEGNEFYTAIEIPTGSFTKYETDSKTGLIVVDRFMSMSMVYPANYGSITSSLGGDGDPLDALVYSREPIAPGAIIRVRAIGVLKLTDGGDKDDKIVAVPVSKIDPTYDAIKEISDLPAIEQQRLTGFFSVYKNLPQGGKKVEVGGFAPAADAETEVSGAIKAYRDKK